MMVRFDTWERAAVFATKMQAEGRHAVVLDGGVGFLWGPLAVGGVRVAVSDIVLEDDGEWPGVEIEESEFAKVARHLVATFALGGPILGLVFATAERARDHQRPTGDAIEVLIIALTVAGSAASFAILGSMMPAFTSFLRNDELFASGLLRLLVALLCMVALL